MGLGGIIKHREDALKASLLLAYTGRTRFVITRWKNCRHRWWVLDYINQGQQQQRIGRGQAFTRTSGVAALYAPGRDYGERQIVGGSIDESYIIFEASGPIETWLKQFTGAKGCCHFRDPDQLIGTTLRRAAELVFYRRLGFHLLAHAVLMELLGTLFTSSPLSPNLRQAGSSNFASGRNDLIGVVERYIQEHIVDPVRVADLAKQTKMSISAFAHEYSRRTGESPYQTVLRLKIETAKRLLLQENLSVKQCAERLRFSSEFHFSRLFKRLEGMSPKRYQKALMQKVLGSPGPPRDAVKP